jgi:hypothetical protein
MTKPKHIHAGSRVVFDSDTVNSKFIGSSKYAVEFSEECAFNELISKTGLLSKVYGVAKKNFHTISGIHPVSYSKCTGVISRW